MKTGRTLQQLAAEVERQTEAKRDLIAPVSAVSVDVDHLPEQLSPQGEVVRPEVIVPRLDLKGDGAFGIGEIAHHQIATDTSIPIPFYDRLRADYPALWARTVNTLIPAIPAPRGALSARRMVRTLDGKARAWLSDSYRPLDNYELLGSALPVFGEYGDRLRFASMELTERRMYLKVISTELEAEIKTLARGDVVRGGVVISNSEIRFGRLVVAPFTEILACTNGAIHMNFGTGKRHVGRRAVAGIEESEAFELFADDTRKKDDEAFFLKMRDLIRATLTPELFGRVVNTMREAAGVKMEGSVERGIEVMAKRFQLTDGERGSILRHLIEGGNLSQYGLHNAVTRTAQDAETYDRATELETLGGELLSMPATDLRPILQAA